MFRKIIVVDMAVLGTSWNPECHGLDVVWSRLGAELGVVDVQRAQAHIMKQVVGEGRAAEEERRKGSQGGRRTRPPGLLRPGGPGTPLSVAMRHGGQNGGVPRLALGVSQSPASISASQQACRGRLGAMSHGFQTTQGGGETEILALSSQRRAVIARGRPSEPFDPQRFNLLKGGVPARRLDRRLSGFPLERHLDHQLHIEQSARKLEEELVENGAVRSYRAMLGYALPE